MNEARLAAGVEVSGLLARAQAEGGFGAVLQRGDAERGSVLLIVAERGVAVQRVERLLQRSGAYAWEARPIDDPEALQLYLARARDRDPDLWILELDVPSAERFIAGMTAAH